MDEATIFHVFIGFMGTAFIVILLLIGYFEKKWDRENK